MEVAIALQKHPSRARVKKKTKTCALVRSPHVGSPPNNSRIRNHSATFNSSMNCVCTENFVQDFGPKE